MVEIGFTGTRQGMTIPQHAALVRIMLSYHKSTAGIRWHHGMCVGADEQCHDLALIFDFSVWGHPPDNSRHVARVKHLNRISAPLPYLDRNHAIVDECDILIATPNTFKEVLRSGTWATIRYAKKTDKKVVRIDPYGGTHI